MKYCKRGKYKNERQAHYFRVADTDRLFIFISIIFPRKYPSDLSPGKKYPYIVLSRTGAEKLAPRTRRKKKIKIANTYGRIHTPHVCGEREKVCDNGPQLLFTNFHQRGDDGKRSPWCDRMLNNIGTFYKRPRAAFYRPRPELEKCLCGSASTPPRNNVFQKSPLSFLACAEARWENGGPRVRKGIVGKKDDVPRVTQSPI